MSSYADWVIAVTNDLSCDQRMMRIANTLTKTGLKVTIVGREQNNSEPVLTRIYSQHRLKCFFQKGPFFYLEYNIRLFWFLIANRGKKIYSVDNDTLLASTLACFFIKCELVFDAHEDFTEVPELIDRPIKRSIWRMIGKWCIPRARLRLTVGESIANELAQRYRVPFEVIRNMPSQKPLIPKITSNNEIILVYQGYVNRGRGIKDLIIALREYPKLSLNIIGKGDIWYEVENFVSSLPYKDRINLLGWRSPDELHQITSKADIGVNLLDPRSPSYYHSLANKFLDYIMAGVPVMTMDFPEYRKINDKYKVALLVNDLSSSSIKRSLSQISENGESIQKLRQNTLIARQDLNWEIEEQKLLQLLNRYGL